MSGTGADVCACNAPARRSRQPLGAACTTPSFHFRCRTCCSCQRGRSCCRTRRSWGYCSGWRRTCRCWSCTPLDRLPSTAPCNSLQAATRMLAGVGWQVSILLGIGISAIPLQAAQTHCSAHTHLQCAPWAREVLSVSGCCMGPLCGPQPEGQAQRCTAGHACRILLPAM